MVTVQPMACSCLKCDTCILSHYGPKVTCAAFSQNLSKFVFVFAIFITDYITMSPNIGP